MHLCWIFHTKGHDFLHSAAGRKEVNEMTQTNNLKLSLPEGSDKVDVGVLRTNFTALDGVLGQHASRINQALATVGSHGKNCRLTWGFYTGNGAFGAANPTLFITGFAPVIAIVAACTIYPTATYSLYRDTTQGSSPYGTCNLIWGADRLSIYHEEMGSGQFNVRNQRYIYVIFGFDS